MKRIVQIIDTLDSGGKERQFVELVKGLARTAEVECHLIIMSETIHYTELFKLGVPVHTLIRRTKRDYRIFFRLFRLLRELKPDILHSWSSMCSVYALPAVKMQNIHFVNGFLRNAPPSLTFGGKIWFRSKITFPFSDAIVSNSKAGLHAYKAPQHKSHYIYNGFDFKRLNNLTNPVDIRNTYDIRTDLVVGMISSFTDTKDYLTFIRAAERILSERNDVTFLAIGEGENRQKCMQAVSSGYRKGIRFLGRLKDIESIIQIITVGVLCSPHGEGISNSIMEYMALGKPVVATNCGGNKELIIDGETGYLVENKNDEVLAERIVHILENPDIAHQFGTSASRRLQAKFNLERMTADYLELYTKITNSPPGVTPQNGKR